MAYVETGEVQKFWTRPVWEAPTTVLVPLERLPALVSAVAQSTSTIRRLLER